MNLRVLTCLADLTEAVGTGGEAQKGQAVHWVPWSVDSSETVTVLVAVVGERSMREPVNASRHCCPQQVARRG